MRGVTAVVLGLVGGPAWADDGGRARHTKAPAGGRRPAVRAPHYWAAFTLTGDPE